MVDAAGMLDKSLSEDAAIGLLADGMTLGVGGWATRRKPMSLIRAIARSSLKDLTVVSYGGPDVGILLAAGKVSRLVFSFVSLDHLPLDPHFRAARQQGLKVWELDEGLLHWGLRAAAMRLPFLPTRAGLGTDIARQPEFGLVRSPFEDNETLLAMPAIRLDAALLHVHRSDRAGNTLTLSPDPFFDELMARAADRVIVSAERVVSTEDLGLPATSRFNGFERSLVTAVVEARFGAHPTAANPDYGLDLEHLRTYAESSSPEGWAGYRARYIDVEPAAYLEAVGGPARFGDLPPAIY